MDHTICRESSKVKNFTITLKWFFNLFNVNKDKKSSVRVINKLLFRIATNIWLLKLYWRMSRRNIYSCKSSSILHVFFQFCHLFKLKQPFDWNFHGWRWVDDSDFRRFSVRQTYNIKNSWIFSLRWFIIGFHRFWFAWNNILLCQINFSLVHNPKDKTTLSKNIFQFCSLTKWILAYLQRQMERNTEISKGIPIIKIAEIQNEYFIIFESLRKFQDYTFDVRSFVSL